MGKRQIFILLAILAGTFVAAEDAPKTDAAGEPVTPEPIISNATELEYEVGTADGTIDEEFHPDIVDISSGLPIEQVSESPEGSNETAPLPEPRLVMSAPVPMAAPAMAATGGRAKFLVEKIQYKWTIMNYKHHGMEYEEALYSPVFSGPNSEEYQWQLQFYPRGNDPLYKGYAALYLASVGKDGAIPEVTFSIIDHLGNKVNTKKFKDKKFTGNVHGIPFFVPHQTIEVAYHKIWCPDNRLTLVAEIVFSPGVKNTGGCTDLSETQCLGLPFSNDESSDLRLFLSNNENIRAHKATMMSHSTWFNEKLRGKKRVNAIRLPANVKTEDLREAVNFIYTGKVHPSMAQRLKVLADQLGMSKLKAMCEEVLCKAAINASGSSEPAAAA